MCVRVCVCARVCVCVDKNDGLNAGERAGDCVCVCMCMRWDYYMCLCVRMCVCKKKLQ